MSDAVELAGLLEQRAVALAVLDQAVHALEAAESTYAEADVQLQAASAAAAQAHTAARPTVGPDFVMPSEQRRRDADQTAAAASAAWATFERLRSAVYEPSLVAKTTAGQRVSQLRGRLRAIDTQIDLVEQRIADATAVVTVSKGARLLGMFRGSSRTD